MAVEFLDEVAPASGVEWLDDPIVGQASSLSPGGVEFTADEPSPAPASEIGRRFLDPNYQPTRAEFQVYQKARKERTLGQHVSDDLELVGGAITGLWDTVAGVAKAIPAMVTDPEANDPIMTAAEGVKRGTLRDLQLAKKLLPSEWGAKVTGGMNFDQFVAVKVAQINSEKFRYHPLTPENIHTQIKPGDLPPEVISKYRGEFDQEFKPQAEYESFLAKRQGVREEIATAQKRIPGVSGDISEGVSLVASPLALVPFGKALTPAKTITRALAAKTLEGAGKTFEWVGEKTVQAARIPERIAGGAARVITGSEEAGEKVAQRVAAGGIGATVVSPFVAIPGVTEAAVVTTAGKVTGKTMQGTGQAAQAAGRAVAEGPSRYGLFDRIRLDAKAPEWMRRSANAARPLDPAVSLAGTAAKGATEGAAIGAALGGIAEGEEGAASGIGAGLALGAGGAVAGRLIGSGRHNEGLKDRWLATWLAGKSADEVLNIRNLNLTRQQALALADMERLARGVVEPGRAGDIEFRYVNDKEFRERFGGIGKGAQTLEGDRPVVFVNTDYRGPRSALHEVSHALDALDAFAPQRQQLNRLLFDQTAADGTVLGRGIYSAADVAEFGSQYRSRLPEAARAEWDLLTPEARQSRILSEVRAESFANLLGSGTGILPVRSIRSRVADKLLLADNASFLGRMRRGLEGMGVKFNGAGEPSELFVRNGRPITNTPAVDAALRDYLRAKDQITRKLTAGGDAESPDFVVRPQDLLSKGNGGLIETFKDHDIFAKNPDGTVRMLGGVPVLLSEREIRAVQSRRVDAMLDALISTPTVGEAGAMRMKPNEAWEGSHFSDAQLAKLLALPDDVLSPSMKSKLQELNALARAGDGSQIILDYNAALRGGKYSSGIAPTVRAAVPLTFNISKAGNFFMVTLDTSHFFRKLGEWRKSKPRAFDAWSGDVDSFLRDTFAYLDNHRNGREGATNLDSDPATAVHKRNVINNFFNVPQGDGVNPVQISGTGNKENLIRSRRFDRINRITPGAGDKFPVKYDLIKANFLPDSGVPKKSGAAQPEQTGLAPRHGFYMEDPKTPGGEAGGLSDAPIAGQSMFQSAPSRPGEGATPPKPASGVNPKFLPAASHAEVIKQTRNQAVFELSRKVPAPPNLAHWLATAYLDALDQKLNRGSRLTRTAQLQQVVASADATSPEEMSHALTVLMLKGQNGAKEHLAQLAGQK